MADQASVNGGKRVPVNSPLTAGVFGNLADLANDVASLVELQAKLAVVDLKATVVKATIPLGLVAGGAAVLVAALPVLMIGLAELLADGLGLAHRGWAYLIVAAGGAVLAGLLVLLGLPRLLKSFDSFQRTRDELDRNVAWVKTVIANSGRPPVHRRR